jgi:hypothetical protein
MALLPRAVRLAAIRRRLELELELPEELEFRIARTRRELEQAFALLHDSYLDAGLLGAAHPSGLRMTVHHSLPSTTTLIACWKDDVVATLSVIRDSPFGIPMESEFDVSELRRRDLRFCEVSSLAIAPRCREKGRILFPLVKYLMLYTRDYCGINRQLLVTHPFDADLYGAIAMARPLSNQRIERYGLAHGAPALASVIDLDRFREDLQAAFAGAPPQRNYYRFVYESEQRNFKLPERSFHTLSDPVMTPALLDYFFNVKTSTFALLGARERLALHACYPFAEYAAVLPPIEGPEVPALQEQSVRLPG